MSELVEVGVKEKQLYEHNGLCFEVFTLLNKDSYSHSDKVIEPKEHDKPLWSYIQARDYWRTTFQASDTEAALWIKDDGDVSHEAQLFRLHEKPIEKNSSYFAIQKDFNSDVLNEKGYSYKLPSEDVMWFLPSQVKAWKPRYRLMSYTQVIQYWKCHGLNESEIDTLLIRAIDANDIKIVNEAGNRIDGEINLTLLRHQAKNGSYDADPHIKEDILNLKNKYYADDDIKRITQKELRLNKSQISVQKLQEPKKLLNPLYEIEYQHITEHGYLGRNGNLLACCFVANSYFPPDNMQHKMIDDFREILETYPEVETLYNQAIEAIDNDLYISPQSKNCGIGNFTFPAPILFPFFEWYLKRGYSLNEPVYNMIKWATNYRKKGQLAKVDIASYSPHEGAYWTSSEWGVIADQWLQKTNGNGHHTLGTIACYLHGIKPIEAIDFVIRVLPHDVHEALQCTDEEATKIIHTFYALKNALVISDKQSLMWNCYCFGACTEDIEAAMKEKGLKWSWEFYQEVELLKTHEEKLIQDSIYAVNFRAKIARIENDYDLRAINESFWRLAEACCYALGITHYGDGYGIFDEKPNDFLDGDYWKPLFEEDARDEYIECKEASRSNHKTFSFKHEHELRHLYKCAYAAANNGKLRIINERDIADSAIWRITPEAFMRWFQTLECSDGEKIYVRPQLQKLIGESVKKINPKKNIDSSSTSLDRTKSYKITDIKTPNNLCYQAWIAVKESGIEEIIAIKPNENDLPIWSYFTLRDFWRKTLNASDAEVSLWISGDGEYSLYGALFRLLTPKIGVMGGDTPQQDLEGFRSLIKSCTYDWKDCYFLPSQVKKFVPEPEFRLISYEQIMEQWKQCGLTERESKDKLNIEIIKRLDIWRLFSEEGERIELNKSQLFRDDLTNIYFVKGEIDKITSRDMNILHIGDAANEEQEKPKRQRGRTPTRNLAYEEYERRLKGDKLCGDFANEIKSLMEWVKDNKLPHFEEKSLRNKIGMQKYKDAYLDQQKRKNAQR